jgi:hypothetical protein
MRSALRILLVSLLVACSLTANSANKATFYTTWDDYYLYMAFDVQDPDVESTNTAFMSKPWEDSSVDVFLETDNQRAPDRSPSTYEMAVSAGNGSCWLVGENGRATPKPIYTFKYASRVEGTINQPNDRDLGYTVELAIPWKEVGGVPKTDQVMGFNVVCRYKGDTTGFMSYSTDVKAEQDVQVPAKWGKIKFRAVPTILAMEDGALVCRKVMNRPPTIDGNLGPGEWVRETGCVISAPEAQGSTGQASQPVKSRQFPIEKLSLTPYYIPGNGKSPDPFTDHPIGGTGPWFSGTSVKWQKEQLAGIDQAGIDVALVCNNGRYLDGALAGALQELKSENKSYPMIGLWLDGNLPADATTDAIRSSVYTSIKNFFLQVPDEFRAGIQLPVEKGGGLACIVAVHSDVAQRDPGLVDYCNGRLLDDFHGRKLIWIDTSLSGAASCMDGRAVSVKDGACRLSDKGWIRVVSVSPGYDDSAVRKSDAAIISRMGGDTFKRNWDALLSQSPDWVIVDSWNDYAHGTEISPTLEYGDSFILASRVNMLRYNGMRLYDAKFLHHNTPAVILPGTVCQTTLTIKNAGTKPWYTEDGVCLAGRWYKDGTLYADSGARIPIQQDTMAGQVCTKTIGIRSVDSDQKPLPEGDYEIRWEMMRGRDDWFSGDGALPLVVPVKIGTPKPGFTVVESLDDISTDATVQRALDIKIRNDGPEAIKAADLSMWCEWANAGGSELPIDCKTLCSFTSDLEPGRVEDARVGLTAADLSTWASPLNMGWCFADPSLGISTDWRSNVIPSSEGLVAWKPITLGAKFITHDTPREVEAGKLYGSDIIVENDSPNAWKKDQVTLGYRWFNMDGSSAVSEERKTALPNDVKPGERVLIKAPFDVPALDGKHYITWDLMSSDTSVCGSGDSLSASVNVVRGKMVTCDLAKNFDACVASNDLNRQLADADGDGRSFPWEFLPPFYSEGVILPDSWLSGMCVSDQTTSGSDVRVPFRFALKVEGEKDAVTCKGQTLAVKPGRYCAVHLAVLSSMDTTGEFTLEYGDKKETAKIAFSPWNQAPIHGESVAFEAFHRHSRTGDQPGQPCFINSYTIQADSGAELKEIILPDSFAVKILAITCEKP